MTSPDDSVWLCFLMKKGDPVTSRLHFGLKDVLLGFTVRQRAKGEAKVVGDGDHHENYRLHSTFWVTWAGLEKVCLVRVSLILQCPSFRLLTQGCDLVFMGFPCFHPVSRPNVRLGKPERIRTKFPS